MSRGPRPRRSLLPSRGRAGQARRDRVGTPSVRPREILDRPEIQQAILAAADEEGLPPDAAFRRARSLLREIAASHSPLLVHLFAHAIRWVYRRGYGRIVYDRTSLQRVAALGRDHPVAFLPSHRSHLDRLSLQYLLWENRLPPNHTAAGVNMDFFPVGPLIRRTGAFFIRRSFKDDPLYKLVLRAYLDLLVERRIPLEWYMEGGRSRSGKLLPPRYGLLGWVVDSVRRGKAEDLFLVPTSIAYDQIWDVADYAAEALGAEKRRESLAWALQAIRSFRRHHGNIHVRFAEPISVTKELAAAAGDPDQEGVDLDLQKLAFEVMYRIAQVTPVTPTSLVSIALLSAPGRTGSPETIAAHCSELQRWIELRGLPTSEPLRLQDPDRAREVLLQLAEHGSVTPSAGSPARFHLDEVQALHAAYYRNVVVHFFVPGAVAELALLAEDRSEETFWEEVARLRDLLKFELYFPGRRRFREEVAREVPAGALAGPPSPGRDGGRDLLRAVSPLRAHWALLPFLDAYLVVADELRGSSAGVEDHAFLQACLARGHRYRREGRVASPESVSAALFSSALELARNRGLLVPAPGVPERRDAFAREVADLRGRAAEVATIAALGP